ncbi:MAG: bifunctional phosphopantothenoylcysteine decarboxylase/phosphopantothenate--cysteine ligase CoaBC [Chloroflexi bacterium]|nr:MAG: bifunctional phosphopantothenoylcysteine decarboxylase/phosphopantothenate--cysteine ligase CoaBC [Chloroflexota bacterium]
MSNPLESKHIILGVTGSIACYKAADLASKLTQAGALVDVILTASALQFVTPLTFQSVTGRRAFTDAELWGHEAHVLHVGLGHSTDMVVVAPATANTMAKLARGIADNLLTVTALAANCPLLIAPAMDGGMFSHPATQENLEILQKRGAIIVGPASGHLASGLTGPGRMVEPSEILALIRQTLVRSGPLGGKKIVVTAGGTQEPIDPVRVIANRSSGKQGYALAQAALDLGAEVVLISGPTALSTPHGTRRIDVSTAQDMLNAVLSELINTDALLMAAAVADFRPKTISRQKIKKEGGIPDIQLEKTPDILAEVARQRSETGFPRLVVGFAAESQDLIANAASKMAAKKLDMIVANDISASDAGFSVDTNRVTLIYSGGSTENLPLMDKSAVAEIVLERVMRMITGPMREEAQR